MNSHQQAIEFYERLKIRLEEDSSWPNVYMYKFIVPSEVKKINEVESLFDGSEAEISIKESSKGTYTSVTVKVNMISAGAVIEKYREVSRIEGVISL